MQRAGHPTAGRSSRRSRRCLARRPHAEKQPRNSRDGSPKPAGHTLQEQESDASPCKQYPPRDLGRVGRRPRGARGAGAAAQREGGDGVTLPERAAALRGARLRRGRLGLSRLALRRRGAARHLGHLSSISRPSLGQLLSATSRPSLGPLSAIPQLACLTLPYLTPRCGASGGSGSARRAESHRARQAPAARWTAVRCSASRAAECDGRPTRGPPRCSLSTLLHDIYQCKSASRVNRLPLRSLWTAREILFLTLEFCCIYVL